MIKIYCDGGSRGNPGPAASAFVATENDKVLDKGSKFLGITTNNIAEYNAVILALDWLLNNKKLVVNNELIINLDSQLVERQINGFYRVKDEKLKKLYEQVKTKIFKVENKINFIWGYRDKNTLADTLVNETLDNAK